MTSAIFLSPGFTISNLFCSIAKWYGLSAGTSLAAFAVISYTSNWVYVLFAALGSWIGGFLSITALDRVSPLTRE